MSVVVFYRDGQLENALRDRGIEVHVLDKFGRWDVFRFLVRLVKYIRLQQPDLVYGFLDTANVLIAALKPVLGNTHIVWGVRSAFVDWGRYDKLAKLTYKFGRVLARHTDLIIVNSRSGRNHHIENGYPAEKIRLIPNGIDTDVFFPDTRARNVKREELRVGKTQFVVGIVARMDPMKDYETFLRAAALLTDRCPDARFVCVGTGNADYVRQLHAMAGKLQLEGKIIWIPESHNVEDIYNALDLFTLSSYGEAFPNVVGEAMACGVPCVVTDAGDSAWLVDGVGLVVPTKSPQALAEGWMYFLGKSETDRKRTGMEARERIEREFEKKLLISRTQAALMTLVDQGRG